jgi:polyferredoxin
MLAMQFKPRWIGYSLLAGLTWGAIPFLFGRISLLENVTFGMTYPGIVLADRILGESIHGTVWEIPLALLLNIIVAAFVVFVGLCVGASFRRKTTAPPHSADSI